MRPDQKQAVDLLNAEFDAPGATMHIDEYKSRLEEIHARRPAPILMTSVATPRRDQPRPDFNNRVVTFEVFKESLLIVKNALVGASHAHRSTDNQVKAMAERLQRTAERTQVMLMLFTDVNANFDKLYARTNELNERVKQLEDELGKR